MTFKILTEEPTVAVVAAMHIVPEGVQEMAEWVRARNPECMPDDYDPKSNLSWKTLWPHNLNRDSVEGPEGWLTGNELLVELAGRKCYDAATEVLTAEGWVTFGELKPGIPVMTYSRERGCLEYQRPTDYIQKRHVGKMYTVESRALSLRVTADHEMWSQRGLGPWQLQEAQALQGKKYRVRRTASYAGKPFKEPLWDVPEEQAIAWATFLGYFVAEGCLVDGQKYGVGSRVTIYQRPENAGAVLAALSALGIEPYVKADPRNSVLAINIGDSALARALADFGTGGSSKIHLPAHVFDWPMGVRAALLDALMDGDGTVIHGHRVYGTTSAVLAEQVQRLILLSGRPGTTGVHPANTAPAGTSFKGNFDYHWVREGSQIHVSVNNKAVHDAVTDADETVFCVSVPNRILLVRRNGKVVLCANCYNSFGLKAGKKTNAEYIANTQAGDVPHGSIMYHAKMTFFIGGVSRRVSHELIRHYVGADRTEEGSPSQESTRYVEHSGCYIAHPAILENDAELGHFRSEMQGNYDAYMRYIGRRTEEFTKSHGKPPAGMDRKRIFESASPYLSHSCETSFIWTSNPIALAKMFKERDHEAADLEYLRLARKWKKICKERWPNLFPQPWMQT